MWRSHYKNQSHTHRSPACLLCQTDTRTATKPVHIAYGVTAWLCDYHGSPEFRVARSGRDFNLSLFMAWKSAECLTPQRIRALAALDRQIDARVVRAAADRQRARPGSYHWPHVRRLVEEACKKGVSSIAKLRDIAAKHLSVELRRNRIWLPSARTLRRWRAERRWEEVGWIAPGAANAKPTP